MSPAEVCDVAYSLLVPDDEDERAAFDAELEEPDVTAAMRRLASAWST